MALAGEEQLSEKSGFAEMIETDVRKRVDLLDSVFFCCAAGVRNASPSATTHAHVWINCHSAVGADNRPCTSWFALGIYAAIGGCMCLFVCFILSRFVYTCGMVVESVYFPRERHARRSSVSCLAVPVRAAGRRQRRCGRSARTGPGAQSLVAAENQISRMETKLGSLKRRPAPGDACGRNWRILVSEAKKQLRFDPMK
jgi:hypothetical protein